MTGLRHEGKGRGGAEKQEKNGSPTQIKKKGKTPLRRSLPGLKFLLTPAGSGYIIMKGNRSLSCRQQDEKGCLPLVTGLFVKE